MMVASFLLVYFGIRSYRDNNLAGQFLSAGVCVRILIALITCICYVAMWRSSTSTSCRTLWTATGPRRFTGCSLPDLTRRRSPRRWLQSSICAALPESFVNMAYTFIEPLPVGLVMS